MKCIIAVFLLSGLSVKSQQQKLDPLPTGAVTFKTTDRKLQSIYEMAERRCLSNIKDFKNYKVLIEGASYPFVWLETQPMGGEMYAKRNVEVAKNNQVIFMDHQRADGRLPGMISFQSNILHPHYGWLQGFCFPEPALNMYYWLNQDKSYLNQLYLCLAKFDFYLWRTRDSDGNGCLESWCVYDTGEDNSIRLDGAPLEWNQEFAPNKLLIKNSREEIQNPKDILVIPVPMESMDVMSYSYSARIVLSRISQILNDGKSSFWQNKAKQVKDKIKSYLWEPGKSACYDRNSENKMMDILLSNNIRCMYYGSFDQEMADSFIKKHLLNPKEFWTPMPLPSIAVNDPAFRNVENNNWSGQPQGLTFQRAIKALENYHHNAEVILIGRRLISALKQNFKFTQQFDPFTGKANNSPDGYGPTVLAVLEYISRMYGIQYEENTISWSGLSSAKDSTWYEQKINGNSYQLYVTGNNMSAFINDRQIFQCSSNIRCVTGINGDFLSIVGIDSLERDVKLSIINSKNFRLKIRPNCTYAVNSKGRMVMKRRTPFSLFIADNN